MCNVGSQLVGTRKGMWNWNTIIMHLMDGVHRKSVGQMIKRSRGLVHTGNHSP